MTKLQNKFQFKVEALRTLPSPYQSYKSTTNDSETIYYLLVNMKNLPDNLPLDVNPREPKMTTNVAKRLLNAVIEPENDFYINNRGIVIAAKSLKFNSMDHTVTIDLGNQNDESDHYSYGILDGGHTYRAIMTQRDQIPDAQKKYVRLEVITNVQNITRLSDARNTSVQVSDIALFNLDDNFADVQAAIAKEPYRNKIAYKDNAPEPIHISDLIRLLYAFDIDKYPDDMSAPIQSYSGAAQVFKRYQTAYDTAFYKALTKELPTLVRLYDTIEATLSKKYAAYKKASGVQNPRFGSVRGITPKESSKTKFLGTSTDYQISNGYIFPIFGAFRSLLRFDQSTGVASWVFDPIDIWNSVGDSLAQNTFESISNPQLAGKDKQLWLTNYRIVETQSLRQSLKQQVTSTPKV